MSHFLKSVFVISFLILLFAVIISLQMVKREQRVILFVTGDTQGYLVPCGCKTSPSGGLSRRVTLMEKISLENKNIKIYPIEIPNVFADRNPAKDILNRAMGEFFERRGYLVGVGERDLSLKEKLKEYYQKDYYSALQNNFKDEYTIEFGGIPIINLGKKGKLHLLFLSEGENSSEKVVDFYRKKASAYGEDGIVILGRISPNTIEKIVSLKGNLLAVIATWERYTTSLPQKTKGAWTVYLGDKGRRYATLDVSYYNGRWEVWPETGHIEKEIEPNKEEEIIVEKVLKEVEKYNRVEIEKIKEKNLKFDEYKGSFYCKDCHQKEYEMWEKSNHFSATKILEIDHQENNSECLICHSTAFGEGGYPNDNIDFSGVGCESCHGGGKNHPPSKMKVEKGVSKCLNCHTKRDSPFFNDGYLLLINHTNKGKDKKVSVVTGVVN